MTWLLYAERYQRRLDVVECDTAEHVALVDDEKKTFVLGLHVYAIRCVYTNILSRSFLC